VRSEALRRQRSRAAARGCRQGGLAAAGDRRGRGRRRAGHAGDQQHARRDQGLRGESARLRRPPQGNAAGHGGLTLAKATLEHVGRARRVEIDKEHTTIIGGAGDALAIRERAAAIRKERDTQTGDYERKQLEERIAKLSGGVALIKIGAATEVELKERKLRVEDALHATRAAVEEGIVPGGGIALLRARSVLRDVASPSLDHASGIKIVQRALEEPLRRIVSNAADEPSIVLHKVDEAAQPSFGYNAATREYGDMLAMGVIDPAKVTRLALQNAASIASLVLTTDCMVADAPTKQAAAETTRGGGPEMY
jgi:chaperonin GroEL